MLNRVRVLNKIEVLPETGHLQVRWATRILEDGQPVAPDQYVREAFAPGQQLPDDIDPIVRAIAAVVWA